MKTVLRSALTVIAAFLFVFLLMSAGQQAFGQTSTSGALLPFVTEAFPSANGVTPDALGFVCTFSAGTTTPLVTYQDSALSTANQNPIRLSAAGRPVNSGSPVSIYMTAASYKVNWYAAYTGAPATPNCSTLAGIGALIRSVDNVYDVAQLWTIIFNTKNFDNVRMCDQWPGANAGAKISACIADLPSSGGTADARGFEGAQSVTANFCAGVTKPVMILFNAATFTSSASIICPVNVTFVLGQASIFSMNTGLTLTLASPMQATQTTHFAGVGSVSLNQVTSPKWFGAKGNGRTVTDAAMTSGSPTLTSATAVFVPADVGNTVYVCDATSAGVSLGPVTISAYTSATTVTLSSNAGATVSGKIAVIGYNDQDGFTRAIAATPANSTILAPVSTGFYYFPQTKTATGLGAVAVTKNLTIAGEKISGDLSDMVKIKTGPEQSGNSIITPVTFLMWTPASSTNVVFRDLNIEGPEHAVADNIRCFYPGTTDSMNTITFTNIYSRKCGTFIKIDQAATNGGKKLYVNNSDIDVSVDDPVNGLQNTFLINARVHTIVTGGTFSNHANGYTFYFSDSGSFRFTGSSFVKSLGSGDQGQRYISCHGIVGGVTETGSFQQVSNSSFNGTGLTAMLGMVEACGESSTYHGVTILDSNSFFSDDTAFTPAILFYGAAAITNSYFRHVGTLQVDVMDGDVHIDNSHFVDSYVQFGGTSTSSVTISDSIFENVSTFSTLGYLISIDNANITVNLNNLTMKGGGPNTPGAGATAQLRFDHAASVYMSDLKMYNTGIDTSILIPTLQNITGELSVENTWFQDTDNTVTGKVYAITGTSRATNIQPRHSRCALASDTIGLLSPNCDAFNVSGTNLIAAFSWGTALQFTGRPTSLFNAEISLIADGAFQMRDSTWITSRSEGPRAVGSVTKLRYDFATDKWIEYGDGALLEGAPVVASGFGTSPSIVAGKSPSFQVNVGTGGTANAGVLTMPTAANGWTCAVFNITGLAANRGDQRTVQTASSTTTVTVQNQTISTGAALAWTASDKLNLSCIAY